MSSLNAIDSWMKATLLADANVTAEVVDRVFLDRAPSSITTYPYIIIQNQTAETVRGVGTASVMDDTIYIVKAVTQGEFSVLNTLVSAIDNSLISPVGGTTIYGDVFACVKESPFRLESVEDGKQYRYLGTEFRVHAQS